MIEKNSNSDSRKKAKDIKNKRGAQKNQLANEVVKDKNPKNEITSSNDSDKEGKKKLMENSDSYVSYSMKQNSKIHTAENVTERKGSHKDILSKSLIDEYPELEIDEFLHEEAVAVSDNYFKNKKQNEEGMSRGIMNEKKPKKEKIVEKPVKNHGNKIMTPHKICAFWPIGFAQSESQSEEVSEEDDKEGDEEDREYDDEDEY